MASKGQLSKVSVKWNKDRKELKITGDFGVRNHPTTGKLDFHNGTDYSTFQKPGLPLTFPNDVEIVSAGSQGGYGYRVGGYDKVLDVTYFHAHLSRIDVKPSQLVSKDFIIGLSGGAQGTPGAGTSTGPHMHLTIAKGRHTVMPPKSRVELYFDPETFNYEHPVPKSAGKYETGEKITFSGYAYTQSNGGRAGSVNYNKQEAVISIITKGTRTLHVTKPNGSAIGWIAESQVSSHTPTPKPDPKPEPSNKLEVGGRFLLNGKAYKNSAGNSGTGKTNHKNTKVIISIVNKGAKFPYHVTDEKGGAIGWVDASMLGQSAPTPPPVYKNEYGQDFKVGDPILFKELYTSTTGGKQYKANDPKNGISSKYQVKVGGVNYFKAKVRKIYPAKDKLANPYELATNDGGVLGRTRPSSYVRKA